MCMSNRILKSNKEKKGDEDSRSKYRAIYISQIKDKI